MAVVRTLCMLLGALGVLLLGAVSPTLASTEPAPCHETADTGSDGPSRSSDAPMKSMACCVACIATPAIAPPVRTGVGVRAASPQPTPRILPNGQRPSPDTGPPKA